MRSKFGTVDGRDVHLFTLTNSSGTEVKITNYGGIVTSLKVPDNRGVVGDVVLGFETLDEYVTQDVYFGALIGRCANRIRNGQFTLAGKKYLLPKNDGPHHLHGGDNGFHKVIWDARLVENPADLALELTYLSRDGEQGYPGNLIAQVIYRLTQDNTLLIDYSAASDAETIVSFTHHSYFNLSYEPTIHEHELRLKADRFTPVDEQLIPTGELIKVEDAGFDFRLGRKLGECFAEKSSFLVDGGLDHNFVLNRKSVRQTVATLTAQDSGRKLEISTTKPGLQVYTANSLDGSCVGKEGTRYPKFGGICLEPQGFPDAANQKAFPSVLLKPGDVYRQQTSYHFSNT